MRLVDNLLLSNDVIRVVVASSNEIGGSHSSADDSSKLAIGQQVRSSDAPGSGESGLANSFSRSKDEAAFQLWAFCDILTNSLHRHWVKYFTDNWPTDKSYLTSDATTTTANWYVFTSVYQRYTAGLRVTCEYKYFFSRLRNCLFVVPV